MTAPPGVATGPRENGDRMDTPHEVARSAEAIWAARQAGRTLDAEATLGTPDLAAAYAIQRALLGLRLAAGEHVVGWKLGYTSRVMREQMGIDEPNLGPLFDPMLLESGAVINAGVVQPRVEPEVAAVLVRDVDHPDSAVSAVGEWRLAIEVVDSV